MGNVKSSSSDVIVSIIMPMHNEEEYITSALQSVLLEEDIPFEVILVDDGSTDGSRKIVDSMGDSRVKIIDGTCKGHASAMNTGLMSASGNYIACCDADDRYPEYRLQEQVSWLEENHEYGAVCGNMSSIDNKNKVISQMLVSGQQEEITSELRCGVVRTSLCTYMLRKNVLIMSGGFRTWFETGGDIDLQLRLSEITRIWYQPELYYFWRIHEDSITHKQSKVRRQFFEASARDFALQRLKEGHDQLSMGRPPPCPTELGSGTSANKQIAGQLVGSAWRLFDHSHYFHALKKMLLAVQKQPQQIRYWKNLAVMLVKIPLSIATKRRF